eukprot:s13_g28.t1
MALLLRPWIKRLYKKYTGKDRRRVALKRVQLVKKYQSSDGRVRVCGTKLLKRSQVYPRGYGQKEQEADKTEAKDKQDATENSEPKRKAARTNVASAAKSKVVPPKNKKVSPEPCPKIRPGVKRSDSSLKAPDADGGAAAPSGSKPAPEGAGPGKVKAKDAKEDQASSPTLADALNRANTADNLDEKDAAEKEEKKKKKHEKRDKATHNRKMRFYRSLDSTSLSERKSQKMQVLFEQWLSASEDWSASTLVLSMRHSHTHTKRGSRRWMTRADLLAKYHGDESIVDEIIREKESDAVTKTQSCRAHPDAPNNPKLKQFLCYDEETEADSEDTVLNSLFECIDSGKNKKKDKKKRKRSTSSSSSSSSSSSEEESSSDSGEKKKSKKKKGKKAKKEKKAKGGKGKSKKEKKKGKADKEKEKEKREKQEQKDKERAAEKEDQENRSKAKKVLNALQSSISDCAKREVKAKKMHLTWVSWSPGIQEVILKELGNLKAKMAEKRDALQSIIDGDKAHPMKMF